MSYSSRTADKFVVRLPDGVREKIELLAKDQHISMNSWIIQRLEAAVDNPTLIVPKPAKASNPSWVPHLKEVVEFYSETGELLHLVVIDDVRVFISEGNKALIMIDASYNTAQGRSVLCSIPLARFAPL